MEGLAAGAACVLTSESGFDDYARDGENCIIIRPGSTEALVDGICRLIGSLACGTRACSGARNGERTRIEDCPEYLDAFASMRSRLT